MSAEGHAVAAAGQDAYVRRAASVDARAGKERKSAGGSADQAVFSKSLGSSPSSIMSTIWPCPSPLGKSLNFKIR